MLALRGSAVAMAIVPVSVDTVLILEVAMERLAGGVAQVERGGKWRSCTGCRLKSVTTTCAAVKADPGAQAEVLGAEGLDAPG